MFPQGIGQGMGQGVGMDPSMAGGDIDGGLSPESAGEIDPVALMALIQMLQGGTLDGQTGAPQPASGNPLLAALGGQGGQGGPPAGPYGSGPGAF